MVRQSKKRVLWKAMEGGVFVSEVVIEENSSIFSG
jgi:hypothetical protein